MKRWPYTKLPSVTRMRFLNANNRFGKTYARHYAFQGSTRQAIERVCHPVDHLTDRSFGTSRDHGDSVKLHDDLPYKAYVALGSNLGNRVKSIEKACKMMEEDGNIRIGRSSSLYETEPMYVKDQHDFINGVCEVCLSVEVVLS